MKRWLSLGFAMLFSTLALNAQSVDRDEFSDILNRSINFVNYSGGYARTDSLAQIQAIGSGLAAGLARDKTGASALGDKYRVVHVLGQAGEKGKPADILFLLPDCGVDHIDNVRRIISAYLSGMYGYAKSDADVLAVFVTVYNAVYRGNVAFFQGRYKAEVLKYLTAEKVGLALRYADWPGKSQIVIPLSLAAADKNGNSLAAVNASSLVTPEVVETVRDKPGNGTKERQDLANLMDRSVDQEQNAIDAKKAALDAESAANQKRQKEIDDKLAASKAAAGQEKSGQDKPGDRTPAGADAAGGKPAPGDAKAAGGGATDKNAASDKPQPASSAGGNAAATAKDNGPAADNAAGKGDAKPADAKPADTKALEAEKSQLAADQKRIADEKAALDQRAAENKDSAKASQDLRADTAKDLKGQGGASASGTQPTIVLKARLENGLILSQALRVVPATHEVLQQSPVKNLVGRRLVPFGEDLLGAVLEPDGTARLAIMSNKTIDLLKKGGLAISPYSELIPVGGNSEVLAVARFNGEWYLCCFDLQLNPIEGKRSDIAVDPIGAIMVTGDRVTVQRKDGLFTSLDLTDLRIKQ